MLLVENYTSFFQNNRLQKDLSPTHPPTHPPTYKCCCGLLELLYLQKPLAGCQYACNHGMLTKYALAYTVIEYR